VSKEGVAKPIRESGTKGNSNLYATLQYRGMLPTPRVLMPTDSPETEIVGNSSIRKNGTQFGVNLETLANRGLLPTPRASDERMHWKTENWKGDDLGSHINEMLGTRSHLSPQFVLEMMGFPPDWTLLPFLSGETSQSKQEEML
jgi:hypothetical protein